MVLTFIARRAKRVQWATLVMMSIFIVPILFTCDICTMMIEASTRLRAPYSVCLAIILAAGFWIALFQNHILGGLMMIRKQDGFLAIPFGNFE